MADGMGVMALALPGFVLIDNQLGLDLDRLRRRRRSRLVAVRAVR
jgi:hypothetical protein